MIRHALCTAALMFCGLALADGSGTLNDSTLSLDYAGTIVLPNPLVLADDSAPPPTCMEGFPTCDTYTLTVDLSDAFRAANASARVEFTLAFADDWDMWLLDSSDTVIAAAAGTDNPEVITLGLKQLANGVYRVQVTPFFVDVDGFTLNIAATGTKAAAGVGKSGSGLALGALGLPALLSLLTFSLIRCRA